MADYKPNQFSSRFEKLAKTHAHQAATQGMSGPGRDLASLEFRINEDTPAVQSYAKRMLDMVQNAGESVVGLKQAMKLVGETVRVSRMEDPSLTKAEKKRIQVYGTELETIIRIKTNIFRQLSQSVGKVVRTRLSGARDATADVLSGSSSGLARVAGFLIRKKERAETEHESDFQKELHEGHSELYQNVAERQKALLNEDDARPSRRMKFDEEFAPRRVGKNKFGKPAPLKQKLDTGDEVLNNILNELKSIHTLLADEETSDERKAKQKERDENLGPQLLKSATGESKPGEKPKSLFGSIFSGLKNAITDVTKWLSGVGGLSGVLKKLIPSMADVLLPAIAVVGAALAGWEIGKMIDKWTHASDLVEKIADFLAQKVSGRETDHQQKTEQDLAVINQARLASKGKLRNLTVDQAREFLKQRALVQERGLRGDAAIDAAVEASGLKAAAPTSIPKLFDNDAYDLTPNTQLQSQTPMRMGPTIERSKVARAAVYQPSALKLSDEGLQAIKKREGFLSEPRWDVSGWAIGYGQHEFNGKTLGTDPRNKPNLHITKDQAEADMKKQVEEKYAPVVRNALKTPVTQAQFDSLVSVAWNSTKAAVHLAKKLNKGESLSVNDYLKSATVHGHTNSSLVSRRTAEFKQAEMTVQPSPTRSVVPVAALTSASGANQSNPTVIAPQQTIMAGNQGRPGSTVAGGVIPIPIAPDNPDAALHAFQSINGM